MKNIFKPIILTLTLALAGNVTAQINSESLIKITGVEPAVEINLGAMMLGLLSSATEEDEEGIANILSSLKAINVLVFELEDNNKLGKIKSEINKLAEMKLSSGYEKLAVIKEDDSLVYIFAQMDDKNLNSLSVFALDDDDSLVLIDIQGTILMSQIGKLMQHFDVDLDINSLKIKNHKKKD